MNLERKRQKLRDDLLAHYEREGRQLPWRIRPEARAKGEIPDPYAVWLSEIMLQQTTVAHAQSYWYKFLEAFPTIQDLAHTERDVILAMWAGLGYYARGRNLHKCAQIICSDHNGQFPRSEAALLKLPGIGPYTAATMAAICFDEATNIVDGNVERVIARLYAVTTPLPVARAELRALAGDIADPARPGDYGQALMDLGAQICTPRRPTCERCPWQWACLAYTGGQATDYPRRTRKARPKRYGSIFVLHTPQGLLMQQRPETGLLGGMLGFPGTKWQNRRPQMPLKSAPLEVNWQKSSTPVQHVFTHFELFLDVYSARQAINQNFETPPWRWVKRQYIDTYALPTLMKKVLKQAETTLLAPDPVLSQTPYNAL